MNASPGWYQAQGDPPGTVRWWDGSQWVGEPQAQATPAPQQATPGQQQAAPVFPGAPPAASHAMVGGETWPDRGPLQWYLTAFRRWNDFSGRSRRAEYWWFSLINTIISWVANIVGSVLTATDTTVGTGLGLILSLGAGLYGLVVLIPSLAAGIRRLHDLGRSGWFLLLWFVPCIGWLVLIVWFFTDGQRHANQYGPDPKSYEHARV